MHRPQQQRGTADGDRRIAFTEYRKVEAQGAEQQYEIADIAQPGADPVAPGRREAHVVTETGLGVGIHPAIQVRLAVGQGLEHKRQGQHANGGDAPADQHRPDIGTRCHILRQREDPATDHRADHQRDQRAQAQLLSRFAHASPIFRAVIPLKQPRRPYMSGYL